ncbi:MAG: hypothetical protein UU93_C0007G0013 [Candidatus Amesbacteria bacterium GW2011_GWA2_42_12]|uniref:Glycosyl transferase group 1 n=1 Tax=Candidatus Amesbacteria bacterium GW2011_GWA2_42_12 TaxID=1618356 RepID=A0A0G1B4D3_9BACT|nr:MAG: hypothetical protein UU93_C0007G0013 [Candidatus Amesbacteria bacterium GW2011_GWA2_42_12]
MRIGIDASRAFVQERTGTEEYSYQLISNLMQLPEAKEHEWILYVKPNAQYSILNAQLTSNFKFKIINLPYLWTQIGLAARTWVDKLDVLWIPAHTLPVLRKPSIKTIVTIHGIEYEWLPQFENKLQRWYLPLSTKYAVMSASRIIAVSEFTKKQLVERLRADSEKIEVVHEGVSSTPLSDLPPKLGGRRKWGVLKKYGLKSKKYILFIGTVQPRKNLVRLIKAFSRLNPKRYALVIAGKLGWNYQDVLDEINNSIVKDQIVIVGYINNIERDTLLYNALVYVQPSITEGFGLPILEAFAAGLPILSSNGGALPEVVGDAGLLFDPLDQLDLFDKLAKIISNPKLRKLLITRGFLRIQEFSWKKAAKKTYSILISTHSKQHILGA